MIWVTGIDISNHQGMIDWDLVNQAAISFVYMLTSDGTFRGRPSGATLSVASAFARNRQKCRHPCGAYHYARPFTNKPLASADQVFSEAGHMDLPYMLDLERDPSKPDTDLMSVHELVDWCGQWMSRIEHLDGKKPILYVGNYFKDGSIPGQFPENIWLLPAYTANTVIDPEPMSIAKPKTNNRPWDMWQYTDNGRVPGIAGRVDKIVVHVSVFARLIGVRDIMSCFFGFANDDEQDALVISSTGIVRVPLAGLDIRQWLIDGCGFEDRTIVLTDPEAIHRFKQLPVAGTEILARPDADQIAERTVNKLGTGFAEKLATDALAAVRQQLRTIVEKL